MKPKEAVLDFFVSYNQHDRGWAEWIAREVTRAGFTVRIQSWDMPVGSIFTFEIDEALRKCRCLVAVLSPDYLQSDWCRREFLTATAADVTGAERRVLPFRVRKCEPDGLMKDLVYEDLAELDRAAARERLLAAVRRCFPSKNARGHAAFPAGTMESSPSFPASFLPPPEVPESLQAFTSPVFETALGTDPVPALVESWLEADSTSPLIMIPHFGRDVEGVLWTAGVVAMTGRSARWRPGQIRWLSASKVAGLEDQERAGIIQNAGSSNAWIVYGTLKAANVEPQMLKDALQRLSEDGPILFLVNFASESGFGTIQQETQGFGQTAETLMSSTRSFADWAARFGHRCVFGISRPLLRYDAFWRFARNGSFAAPLFSDAYEQDGQVMEAAFERGVEDAILPLSKANSHSMLERMRSFFARLSPAAAKHSFSDRAAELLALARALCEQGFYEPAYRLETFVRCGPKPDGQVSLSADIETDGQVKGLLKRGGTRAQGPAGPKGNHQWRNRFR